MTNLRALLDTYVIALNAGAEATTDPLERSDYAERLAGAHRMQAAVEAHDLGRLAAELHDATRLAGAVPATLARAAATNRTAC